jgi:hypothetical protein
LNADRRILRSVTTTNVSHASRIARVRGAHITACARSASNARFKIGARRIIPISFAALRNARERPAAPRKISNAKRFVALAAPSSNAFPPRTKFACLLEDDATPVKNTGRFFFSEALDALLDAAAASRRRSANASNLAPRSLSRASNSSRTRLATRAARARASTSASSITPTARVTTGRQSNPSPASLNASPYSSVALAALVDAANNFIRTLRTSSATRSSAAADFTDDDPDRHPSPREASLDDARRAFAFASSPLRSSAAIRRATELDVPLSPPAVAAVAGVPTS